MRAALYAVEGSPLEMGDGVVGDVAFAECTVADQGESECVLSFRSTASGR